MTTVVNNPAATTDAGSPGVSMIIGSIFLLVVVGILLYFGMSIFGGGNGGGTTSQPQDVNVQMPDKVDVNVQNPAEGQ